MIALVTSARMADCFAYGVAKENRSPLLFVGGDFKRAEIESVL